MRTDGAVNACCSSASDGCTPKKSTSNWPKAVQPPPVGRLQHEAEQRVVRGELRAPVKGGVRPGPREHRVVRRRAVALRAVVHRVQLDEAVEVRPPARRHGLGGGAVPGRRLLGPAIAPDQLAQLLAIDLVRVAGGRRRRRQWRRARRGLQGVGGTGGPAAARRTVAVGVPAGAGSDVCAAAGRAASAATATAKSPASARAVIACARPCPARRRRRR